MTSSGPPGRLIGSGRGADVYELDANRVLRRYRASLSAAPEARVMSYLHAAGYPVPEVFDVDGQSLIMARLSGRDMLAELGSKPWLAARHARTLAHLHDRLHQIPAPPDLPHWSGQASQGGAGADASVLHLDLHPGNVMLTAEGPVVIDWSSAAAGPAGLDVAIAKLIMEVSEVSDLPRQVRVAAALVRRTFIRQFVTAVSTDARPYLAQAAWRRINDPNVRPAEAELLRRVIRDHSGRTTGPA
jgi:aminoglycoside phosphotransferase (APT) family kinase protein